MANLDDLRSLLPTVGDTQVQADGYALWLMWHGETNPVVLQKLIQGIDVPGYATIIVLILLLGSVQLFCIGIIGEYVGRTFEQSKDRPIYIAKEVLDYEQN